MKSNYFTFKGNENVEIYVYRWSPEGEIKGAVQIAHGMAETAKRYERFAEFLANNGYIVYANDHRGHGNTAKSLDKVGILGEKDGFGLLVQDMHQLLNIIKKENIDKPVFLLGHSMGSFLSQKAIMDFGTEYKGVILSGSNGRQGLMLKFAKLIANREAKKHGREYRSKKLNDLSFGSYNNAFRPNRTEFDWLSSDTQEVDKYVKDPYCGGIFTAGFYQDFITGLIQIEDKARLRTVPNRLPILLMSGDMDPVGRAGKGVKILYNTYKSLGVKDLTIKLYKDGRHEMLNEKNRDQVMNDILTWINKHN